MRILLVHVHPKAEGTTRRHYASWQLAGYDRIVGITTEGGGCYWPNNDTVAIGPNKYIEGAHLCNRLIRTFEYGVNQGASEICVIEHDTVFFKPMPFPFPVGFVMNWTGGNVKPWKCPRFAHNPWHLDVATAKKVIRLGDILIKMGEIEGGNPDLFLGLIAHLLCKAHFENYDGKPLKEAQKPQNLYCTEVHDGLFKSYTRNALDHPEHLIEARQAYRDGAHAIHGIKRPEEISYIMS